MRTGVKDLVTWTAPETPKGTKFPGQPYGKDAEAYLKQLAEGAARTTPPSRAPSRCPGARARSKARLTA